MFSIMNNKYLNSPVGTKLVNPRETATTDDRKALAACCIWAGTTDAAEFLLFLTSSYQIAGRVSEVSSLTLPKLSLQLNIDHDDINDSPYKTISLDVQRQKTHIESKNTIFPHRDTLLFDFYFTLGYFLVLTQQSSSFLLPTFASKLKMKNNRIVDYSRQQWKNSIM